jgi:hypothetical protein
VKFRGSSVRCPPGGNIAVVQSSLSFGRPPFQTPLRGNAMIGVIGG